MNTDTVRLNITLPRHLAGLLNQIAGPRKRSQFIAEALQDRIEKQKRIELENAMAEGYRATRDENITLSREFESIDLENWDEY